MNVDVSSAVVTSGHPGHTIIGWGSPIVVGCGNYHPIGQSLPVSLMIGCLSLLLAHHNCPMHCVRE